jgi:UbiD family decarboxylase
MPFESMDDFIGAAEAVGEVKHIHGASLERDVGCLTELFYEKDGPVLMFDGFEGYPEGFRVCANAVRTTRHLALAFGLPLDAHKFDVARHIRDRRRGEPIPPRVVTDGPVLEYVQDGNAVDVEAFPTPLWHKGDGGRYIGTADMVVHRDPDSGYVNVAVYRAMVQGRDRVSLWMNPQKHGNIIAQRYWEKNEAAPVAVVVGCEPVTWLAAPNLLPFGKSEYDLAGSLRGSPVDVIELPVTGLPVPAHAEIVLEGEIPPPSEETAYEGPFGEWPGYYSHEGPECVVRIKRIYHRHNPIIVGQPPMRPKVDPEVNFQVWDHLERSGITDVTGVWSVCNNLLLVISLRQRYAGHAKQALITAAGFRHGDMKTYFLAVDDDIDASNLGEVLWAMCTRVDPTTDIDVLRDSWTADLDPRIPPQKRKENDLTAGRCLIDATKPFAWKDRFPKSNMWSREDRSAVERQYQDLLAKLDLTKGRA